MISTSIVCFVVVVVVVVLLLFFTITRMYTYKKRKRERKKKEKEKKNEKIWEEREVVCFLCLENEEYNIIIECSISCCRLVLRQTDRQRQRQTDRDKDRQTDGQTVTQTDRDKDSETDRQTETETKSCDPQIDGYCSRELVPQTFVCLQSRTPLRPARSILNSALNSGKMVISLDTS